MSDIRFAYLSISLPALTAVLVFAAGCASRAAFDDEPPRRPQTTSSFTSPQRLTPAAPYGFEQPVARPEYKWNQSPNRIQEGGRRQTASTSRATTAVAPAPSQRTVVAENGDTLYSLSRKHHVSMAALMEANRLRSPVIQPGDRLVLPR